jgi:hypothetical protein
MLIFTRIGVKVFIEKVGDFFFSRALSRPFGAGFSTIYFGCNTWIKIIPDLDPISDRYLLLRLATSGVSKSATFSTR